MTASVEFIVVCIAVGMVWAVALAFLSVATGGRREEIKVSSVVGFRRGEYLVVNGDRHVYRVRAVRAPDTLVVTREEP